MTGDRHQPADIALQPVRDDERAAQFHLRHHLTRQGREHVALVLREQSRLVVEHTDRAERKPVWCAQQCAGIKSEMGDTEDQRIIGEAPIQRGIRNFHETLFENGVRAQRTVDRCFTDAESDFGFEPLPAVIDQVDDRDRGLADIAGKPCDIVECGFNGCIENAVRAQRLQPFRFVRVQRCGE